VISTDVRVKTGSGRVFHGQGYQPIALTDSVRLQHSVIS